MIRGGPVWLAKKAGKVQPTDEDAVSVPKDSLFQRKYVLPFALAVVILA